MDKKYTEGGLVPKAHKDENIISSREALFPTPIFRAKEIKSERPGPPTFIQQWWQSVDPNVGEWRELQTVPNHACDFTKEYHSKKK